MSQFSDNGSGQAVELDQVNIHAPNLNEDVIKSLQLSDREIEDRITHMEKRSKHQITDIGDIKVGSEISFGRRGYKHHAVVVNVNKMTCVYKFIHLSGDSFGVIKASSSSGDGKAEPVLQAKNLRDTQNAFYYIYNKHVQTDEDVRVSFKPEVVEARADALLEVYHTIQKLDYDLRNFNCQHFASYCVTGIPFCKPFIKNLCCCNRGLEVNYEVKKELDKSMLQHFKRQNPDRNIPTEGKENKQSLMNPSFTNNPRMTSGRLPPLQ